MTDVAKLQLIINAEDESELKVYVKAKEMYASLCDLSDLLRTLVKHGAHDPKTPRDAFDHVRTCFYEILEQNGVDLDD